MKSTEQQRVGFEARMKEFHTDHSLEFENGWYRYSPTQKLWLTWQAAIELDRQGRGEPVAASREVLFFTSYCDGDTKGCTQKKPCHACLGMSNVYLIPMGTVIEYVREFAPELNTTTQPANPTIKESLTVAEPVPLTTMQRQMLRNVIHEVGQRSRCKGDYHDQVADLLSTIAADPQPAEPASLCDCERGDNGMGMTGRQCDCPAGNNPQPAEPVKVPSAPDGLWQQAYDKAWSVAHLYHTGAGMLYWLEAEHKRLVAPTPPADGQAQQDADKPASGEASEYERGRQDGWAAGWDQAQAQPDPAMAGDVLQSVWNAMQNSADGDDLLSRLEHMRGSIAHALAEQPASGDDATPDMFWDADDPERNQGSIHNLLVEIQCSQTLEVGDIVEVLRAISLPNISVRITSVEDDSGDGDLDYEVIDAALQQEPGK